MSSLSLLNTSSSQVTVNVSTTTVGATVGVAGVRMELQPGASRLVTANLSVTPSGQPTVPVEVQFLMYDAAFEDTNIHGAVKGQQDDQQGLVGTTF